MNNPYSELTIYFSDYRFQQKPKDSPDFIWTAHFKEKGITAYGDTMEKAINKAVVMLKIYNEIQEKHKGDI